MASWKDFKVLNLRLFVSCWYGFSQNFQEVTWQFEYLKARSVFKTESSIEDGTCCKNS